LQKSFTKNSSDTLEEFSAKIRQIEHEILPLSIIQLLKEL
jgi:folate-dependent phosphoribosylglycinamide formyltransferase PurN